MIISTINKEGKNSMELESLFLMKKRSIFLTGEINDSLSKEIVQQLLYLEDIENAPIHLYINSPGGSVTAGLAIYDIIKNLNCDVITICNGIAASMGAFLLCAGTPGHRYISPHSEVMLHQVLGETQGNASDIEIHSRHIINTREVLNTLLSQMTGQPLEKIVSDTDRDFFMSPKQALDYGVVDFIGYPE